MLCGCYEENGVSRNGLTGLASQLTQELFKQEVPL